MSREKRIVAAKRTRKDVEEFIRENFDMLRVEAIENCVDHIASLEAEEVIEKFWKGAKENGKFDLESICALSELRDEMKDALAYTAFHILQEHH